MRVRPPRLERKLRRSRLRGHAPAPAVAEGGWQPGDEAAPPHPDLLPFHPLANLFPLIEGKAFEDLVADIRKNGLRERIILLDGQLLDGRNRYRAAIAAGVFADTLDPRSGPYFANLPQGVDPLAYVLSKNLSRRHLTESQRAMIAARIASLGVGRPAASAPGGGEETPAPPIGGVSTASAAKALNVGERSIERAKTVQEHGAPELVAAVERGDAAVAAAEAIARLPQERQEEILAEVARSPDGKKAFARVAKVAHRERQETKKNARAVREEILGRQQQRLPDARFGVILADPEWRFEPRSRASGLDRAADNHYPTSALDVIKSRDVASIAADDCVLFLWATAPMLPQALEVMAAWGFVYKTHRIWRKAENADAGLVLGTGYWFRSAHELVLVGTRGAVPAPAMGTQYASIFDARPRKHSEKPDDIHEMIEALFPNLPKIELNARRRREGWEPWGFEVPEAEPVAVPRVEGQTDIEDFVAAPPAHVVARDRHIEILRDIARGHRSGMHDPADPDVAALVAAGEIRVTTGRRGRILAPGIAMLEQLSGEAAEEAASEAAQIPAMAKLPLDRQARNSYVRDVVGSADLQNAPHDYRSPSGPAIGELVPPGTIVRTNYNTGPDVVVSLNGPFFYEPREGGRYEHWSLNLATPAEVERAAAKKRKPKADAWINECVAVDGRILKLFLANTDEVLVDGAPK